ncbi:ABC transporter ATP-binding protein [Streptomyces aidingensis]|uniref:ABC-type multidrug transport system, ATPase component n=1 Tax=Streptomyces aidingensis TaxID=910347 RepID=A0A1I1IF95_9ACTN|nr:ABC transporter ATP-binding protein [Streptomyces aidingensis]SFC34641.1 ABC-type multidrug transport system, ATPase component [Streptomyces aidingensis]
MIQTIGLTGPDRRGRPPAVDDLTFEARPGGVTVLHGPPGAGKSAALRLMLQLQPGRGVALFRGRPVRRLRHPVREIGVLLGDVPGHPGRTVRDHLRMLAAAAGIPAARAEEVMDLTGLTGLAGRRLATCSRGMDRRLGMAAALLGDPHTLVLDEPADGLSPRESAWLYGLLRGHADRGGTVLMTCRDPRDAARLGDHVVTLADGRTAADQSGADFARTRLRPRVVVRTPHAERFAAVLRRELRAGGPLPGTGEDCAAGEAVLEPGGRVVVYGVSRASVGELAYRHRVLVHQLADERGTAGDRFAPAPLLRADGRPPPSAGEPPPGTAPEPAEAAGPPRAAAPAGPEPPEGPGAGWAVAYEIRRWAGLRGGRWVLLLGLLAGVVTGLVTAAVGGGPAARVLTGWPQQLPVPPAALAAGVLGALSYGQEFRFPALALAQVPPRRHLALLAAKLAVWAVAAALLCAVTGALTAMALAAPAGAGAPPGHPDLPGLPAPPWAAALWGMTAVPGPAALCVGCAWAGLLAAGLFRATLAGLAAVAAVPLLLTPAAVRLLEGPAGEAVRALPGGRSVMSAAVPGLDTGLAGRPLGWALAAALCVLSAGHLARALRGAPR